MPTEERRRRRFPLNLPSSIQLAGIEIKTIIDDTFIERQNEAGHAYYDKQIIVIDTSIAKDSYMQTYFHEVIHYIFFIMGRDDRKYFSPMETAS